MLCGMSRERHVAEPLLGAVAERGQPRVDLGERRLDRDQPVAEVGDVALAVGVQEVVQGGDQAHRLAELAPGRCRRRAAEKPASDPVSRFQDANRE